MKSRELLVHYKDEVFISREHMLGLRNRECLHDEVNCLFIFAHMLNTCLIQCFHLLKVH